MNKFIFITFSFGFLFSCIQEENKTNNLLVNETSIEEIDSLSINGYQLFENGSQFFTINTDKKVTISGSEGTRLTIPKDCFNTIEKEITIELKECYSLSKMIKNNLSTITSKNEILETDGMIYINATNLNGDTLNLIKSIDIETITKDRKDDIKIFLGRRDKSIIWELSNEKIQPIKSKIINVPILIEGDSIIKGEPTTLNAENYSKYIYSFTSKKMGWVNLDRYYQSKNYVDIEINLENSNQQALYYLIFEKYNILLSGIEFEKRIQFIGGNKVADNHDVIVIGIIKNLDGTYHFGFKEFNTNQKSVEFPSLKRVTKIEIDKFLHSKFGRDIWSRPSV